VAYRQESNILIVIDLTSSRLALPMVRRAARRAVARAASHAGRTARRNSRPRVLLHGEDPDFARLQGVELLSTLNYAVSPVGSADEPWIDAVARETLYGSAARFFPTVDGISLADLCRLEVQDYFLEYIRLAGALRRVLAEKPPFVCKIFTSDPERADALRSAATGLVTKVESWSPPFIRGLRQAGRNLHRLRAKRGRGNAGAPRLSALLNSTNSAALAAPVLFVSEAAPIAQMFGVVERHLGDVNDVRSLHVQFARGSAGLSIESKGKRTVATLDHPSATPPATVGTFREQWVATAREARSVIIEKPYAGAAEVTALRAPVGHLLEHLYSERFDQLVEHIEFANTMVDLVRPDVLVLGNDRWWVGQAFVRAAQKRGIATLLIQDGLAGDKATWWWISADHVAAFSPSFARMLTEHGVSSHRITITGQPRYDSLCEKRRTRDVTSVRAARMTLGLRDADACFLLATQPHQDAERVAVGVKALLEVGGAHVLLRPHPSEPSEKYDACLAANAGRVSLCAGIDIDELLCAADAVVTEFSTVALEAAILGVPVIIATFLGDRSEPRVFDGLSVIVRAPAALRDAANTFSSGTGAQLARQRVDLDRLHALVGPLDGHSGLRVAHLIESLRKTNVRRRPDSPRERSIRTPESAVTLTDVG
jgi:CDP-Glycerol:Poly(glycerophosphate) glycerophosphotransferase